MLHELQIKNEKNSCCTHVLLDGKSVKCSGYNISQYAGEFPEIELDVVGSLDMFFESASIKLADLDNLIEVMDEDMFNAFCERWKEMHESNDRDDSVVDDVSHTRWR